MLIAMSKEILKKAVQIAGGQVALAARICTFMPHKNIKQAHVWKWLNSPSELTPPPDWVIPICQAVEWEVTPNELRPDIYPNPTDGLPVDRQEAA